MQQVKVLHVDTRCPLPDLRGSLRTWAGGCNHSEQHRAYSGSNPTPPGKRPYWCLAALLTAAAAHDLGWQYEYAVAKPPPQGRHASWVKIWHVLEAWDSLPEVVVVLDTDAWIRDGEGVRHLVGRLGQDTLYLAGGEPEGAEVARLGAEAMNGGFMCFRKDDRVRRWLRAVWDWPAQHDDCAVFKTEWPWEQACMGRAVRANQDGCADWLEVLPVHLCNTPAGTHVSHCWYKDIASEVALDDLLSGLARRYLRLEPPSIELVVARHGEDVSWVGPWLPYLQRVTVYDKSERPMEPFHPKVRVLAVPNRGREAETYVRHVLQHYDDLCGRVVFAQGRYEDHVPRPEFEALMRGTPRPASRLDVPWGRTVMGHFGWTPDANWTKGDPMTPAGMTLGKYALTYVCDDLVPEESVTWWPGAIFDATRDQVRRHPRERYERILATLSGAQNPEAAHVMERLWKLLLDP